MDEKIINSFKNSRFLVILIPIIIILVFDTTIINLYDLIDKYFFIDIHRVVLFSIIASICILLQYLLLKYIHKSIKLNLHSTSLNIQLFYNIAIISLSLLSILIGSLISQQLLFNYYNKYTIISIIILTYVSASFFIMNLSLSFLSWYKSIGSFIVLLYFISMSLIVFNFIMTASITVIKINDRPDEIRAFMGGSIDISVGRYPVLDQIYNLSSILSFISFWITTSIIMNRYRNKLINNLIYWLLLSIPLIYFLINYFYMFIFSDLLIPYLTLDPIGVSIVLTLFLSLSKPIGGLTFALTFWKISRTISYEKNIKTYMIISGWGIILLFGTNQAISQIFVPYPPFGIVTVTVLITASYLMFLGIYNSSILVSINTDLRKSIYKHASESKLLTLIGTAEMEKEVIKTLNKILTDTNTIEKKTETKLEIDENELKKYLDEVIKEIKK